LSHPAGHGQADFGEAVALIGGVVQEVHVLMANRPALSEFRQAIKDASAWWP
jgi:hypothetical protein